MPAMTRLGEIAQEGAKLVGEGFDRKIIGSYADEESHVYRMRQPRTRLKELLDSWRVEPMDTGDLVGGGEERMSALPDLN